MRLQVRRVLTAGPSLAAAAAAAADAAPGGGARGRRPEPALRGQRALDQVHALVLMLFFVDEWMDLDESIHIRTIHVGEQEAGVVMYT